MAEDLKKNSASGVDKKDIGSNSAENASPGGHDAARRKAIKAGLIGVPVILTLKGRTAFAQQLSAGSNFSGGGAPPPVPKP
jgi:hypothetical protein